MRKQNKIRMQDSRVKIGGRTISDISTESRKGEVSRQTRRHEIVGTVDAARAEAVLQAASLHRSSSGNTSGASLFERRWRRLPVTAVDGGTVGGPA
jgi:23S rRNA G2445 N2-methylase RlmL